MRPRCYDLCRAHPIGLCGRHLRNYAIPGLRILCDGAQFVAGDLQGLGEGNTLTRADLACEGEQLLLGAGHEKSSSAAAWSSAAVGLASAKGRTGASWYPLVLLAV